MRNIFLLLLAFLFACISAQAQLGGRSVYSFLDVPVNAHQAALGGRLLSSPEASPNLILSNPALLDTNTIFGLGLSYVNYFADIQVGAISMPFVIKNKHPFAVHLQYINYGEFEGADPIGLPTSNFNAADYALTIAYGNHFRERWSYGVNLKGIASYLESYSSYGLATDLNLMYEDTAKQWNVVLSARNIGTQLTAFRPGDKEDLPFDLQIAFGKKLNHLPLRWGVVAHHLHRFDILYDNPNDDLQNNNSLNEEDVSPGFGVKLLGHFQLNAELLLGKNLRVRTAYDHLTRQEQTLPFRTGRSGFSFGFGLNIKQFEFGYANSSLNLAGTRNHFSIVYKLKKESL